MQQDKQIRTLHVHIIEDIFEIVLSVKPEFRVYLEVNWMNKGYFNKILHWDIEAGIVVGPIKLQAYNIKFYTDWKVEYLEEVCY